MAFDATDFQISSQSQPGAGPQAPVTSAAVDPLTLTTPRERLEYMRDFLRGLPRERFTMAVVATNFSLDTPVHQSLSECGTRGCIAGWTLFVFRMPGRCNAWSAGEMLGLTGRQADELFTPEGYSCRPWTPADAAQVLDHLLRTGEVDWSVARSGQ